MTSLGQPAAAPSVLDGAALLDALAAIADDQLPTGEIASFAPGADGRLAYRRSLRASIAVHEALACLDAGSAWEETRCVRAALTPRDTTRLCLGAARLRRRIRDFLAWQELPGHLWREDGRHGEAPPEPALGAEAAAALMDDPARAADRWPLYARALDRFRGADGRYRSPAGPPGAGGVVDAVSDASVAAYLAVAGEEAGTLIASLEREVEEVAAGRGGPLPLEPACTMARWWHRARLPGRRRLATALVPGLLERLSGAPADAADAADVARILLALVDLGSTSPRIAPAARRLLGELPLADGWTGGSADGGLAAGGSADGRIRCPALTRALVVAAAVRSQAIAEELAA